VGDGSAHSAVYLRDATEGISVLDMRGIVGTEVFATFDELTKVGGTIYLMAMRADGVDALVEGLGHAVQGLQAQSPSDVSDVTQMLCPPGGQNSNGRHHRCAVGQSQALFSPQLDGGETGSTQGLRARQFLPLIKGLSLADEDQRHVSQGGQVATGTQGAFGRNDRVYSSVD